MRRNLLRKISFAPIDMFECSIIETVIACWQWISSARRDLEPLLMLEMVSAWQATIDRRIGLFSYAKSEGHVLAFTEADPPRPNAPNVRPHIIWIKYLQELLESVKMTRSGPARNIISLLLATFPGTMPGDDTNKMSRHVTTVAARMELISIGFSILHSEVLVGDVERSVLRNKLYSAVFDYFSCPACIPTQHQSQIRDDIVSLNKFWGKLNKEGKFLTKPLSGIPGLNSGFSTLNSSIIENDLNGEGSQIGSSKNRSGNSNSGTKSRVGARQLIDTYTRRRHIAQRLIAAEIERFTIWIKPRGDEEIDNPQDSDEEKQFKAKFRSSMENYSLDKLTERNWKEIARVSWRISPFLASHLPTRLKQEPALIQELIALVRRYPEPAHMVPEAIKFLVTQECVAMDSGELAHLLTWKVADPATALSFFSQMFKPNPYTAQYAVKCLRSFTSDQILFYIPQIVQALRYDTIGYMNEYLIWASAHSPLLCHQLMWNMETNRFRDEEGLIKDPEIGDKIDKLLEKIKANFSENDTAFYDRQFKFSNALTEISQTIKEKNKDNGDRGRACLAEIQKVVVPERVYLPSNPGCLVFEIDRGMGIPLQSAAKAPYLAQFKVMNVGVKMLEELATNPTQQILNETSFWQKTIFKAGDDCRQDMLALQIIEIFRNAFNSVGLDVYLFPYKVVATAPGFGIIECIPNSKSRNEIGKKSDQTLLEIFRQRYGDENSQTFMEKRRNFIKSVAAYSLVLFILQIKDRHNGNIMIDDDGHLLHIDFGFMFESSPGGNLGWEPDMKLTIEMVKLMGGSNESKPFKWFEELTVKAFLAVRPYQESIVSLVSLMLGTGLPCFRGQTIKLLRQRFAPTLTEKQAAVYMTGVINRSYLSKWSHTYDILQYQTQGIAYINN